MPLKVPLIDVTPPDEFGAVTDAALANAAAGVDAGATYVPGFSDLRLQRDREIAEVVAGKRAGKDVTTLPVNVRWARNAKRNGEPDNSKIFSAGRLGYEVVTKADIGKPWLKEMPKGAQLNADGSIRNGDTILTVATKERAAANAAYKAYKTRERMEGADAKFAQAAIAAGGNRQGAPSVERSKGDPIAAK